MSTDSSLSPSLTLSYPSTLQKPENILLVVGEDSVPEVRLTDFGSAFRQYNGAIHARAFTLLYG